MRWLNIILSIFPPLSTDYSCHASNRDFYLRDHKNGRINYIKSVFLSRSTYLISWYWHWRLLTLLWTFSRPDIYTFRTSSITMQHMVTAALTTYLFKSIIGEIMLNRKYLFGFTDVSLAVLIESIPMQRLSRLTIGLHHLQLYQCNSLSFQAKNL